MADQVVARKPPGWTRSRTVIRVVLLAAAIGLVWAATRQFWVMESAAKFETTYRNWFGWIGLTVLCAFVFTLACILPRRLHFRPARALLLGVVPLLMVIHASLVLGPTSLSQWAEAHLHFISRSDFLDTPFVPVVLLGVAIAAGFAAD